MDSNHDQVIQSHSCYRYTTGQWFPQEGFRGGVEPSDVVEGGSIAAEERLPIPATQISSTVSPAAPHEGLDPAGRSPETNSFTSST